MPQLTRRSLAPTSSSLAALVADDSSTLLVVREPDHAGPIAAIGCLGVYRTVTGVRAIIEDVVVDEAYRGRGLGEALVKRLVAIAREQGAPGVSLTSNPRREAANRLYLRLGFARRQTNSYYYEFRD